MREIKFRARAKNGDWWYGSSSVDHLIHGTNTMSLSMFWQWVEEEVLDRKTVGEYTGLKDKNGLTEVYESDIIGVDGLVEGNIYEQEHLLQSGANLIVEGFGTKDWFTTYQEAVARGCKDSE